VIHITLVGLEPATFRSLVRRATSSATESTTTMRSHSWLAAARAVVCRRHRLSVRNVLWLNGASYSKSYC